MFDMLLLLWHLASEPYWSQPELPNRNVPARTFFCVFTFGKALMGIRVSLQEGLVRVFKCELNMSIGSEMPFLLVPLCLVWSRWHGWSELHILPTFPHWFNLRGAVHTLDTAHCILDPETLGFLCGSCP